MKKVKNDAQPFALYIIPILLLPFIDFFVAFFMYGMIAQFEVDFWIIYGLVVSTFFFYSITKAIVNGIMYFIPREECYIEDNNLIYRRIFLFKFIFKELKIPLLDIKNIKDRGYKISDTNGDFLNFMNYIEFFSKPYERIVIEMNSGNEYKIFIDTYLSYYKMKVQNKVFIRTYKELKEMVIEEQNKLFFNQKIENLNEKYNSQLDERYDFILNQIIEEEILFIAKKDNNYIVNGSYDAIEYLEIFKNIYFEEVELDTFYSYVLSKKENQDKKVLVGYNGVDGKEVTMSKFKEDINEIRDSRSRYGRGIENKWKK